MTIEEFAKAASVFLGLTILSKMIKDNLPDFSIRNYFQKKEDDRNALFEQRMTFLRNVELLSIFPSFKVEEPTMNPTLVTTFYNIAIEVTRSLQIKKENFNYYRGNFSAFETNDQAQLIAFLGLQKENPKRNDSRYMLGFRSVYFILWQNINKINEPYMDYINAQLSPFWESHDID